MKNKEVIAKDIKIDKLLNDSITFLEKGYLANKDNFKIKTINSEISSLSSYANGIRVIRLTKIVYEEKENILDKLSNVFTALYSNNAAPFLIIDSDGEVCNFYLGIKDEKQVSQSFSILKSSLNGNFSGIEYDDKLETKDIEKIMNKITNKKIKEISTVTGIPTQKINNKDIFFQGIEKVIIGMEGKAFSAVFLATPIGYNVIKEIKRGYENMYSNLYPYLNTSISLTKSEASSISKSIGENFAKSYSENLTKTETLGTSEVTTKNETEGKGYGISPLGFIGTAAGFFVGGPAGAAIGGMLGASSGTKNKNRSSSNGTSTSISNSNSKSQGEIYGETKGKISTETQGKTESIGNTVQLSYKNRALESIIDKIDKNIERIEMAEGNGFWNIGVYFISEKSQNSLVAANIYNGITAGRNSGLEKNNICTFRDTNNLEKIKDYLYNFENLRLNIKIGEKTIPVTLGSQITNEELALKINLPQKSITGLDVIKMASFGRNKMVSKAEGINLGKLYHLGKKYETDIDLDLESLRSHTFITGSTGSGKSNAVYTLLDELYKKDIKFLVIEPTKGEYKNVFGGRENVSVYGTNNKYTELLKINPFSFNNDIHIFEHIDKLIEIFNTCWPLYAAMPAILKDAIEEAYMMVGWDLENSINIFGERRFPTLKDLKDALIRVISQSSYSEENKSNYIGALVTRVNSLDNGIIGNLFSGEEIEDKKLFDENVIIDISRVSSAETKSLLMGIMFIKLQEYRMSTQKNGNEKLKHITVLEEAHHLLKNTTVNTGIESNNLQGKSIEMLTNAIAEMRTYGQGFIIVDQAPELLDSSAIRNTNTKICLRLPSLSDREIVGHSMNLSDEQIEELAKLETGVAAITQTNWKESCLTKINLMDKESKYIYASRKINKRASKNEIKALLFAKLPKEHREGITCNRDIERMTNKELDRRICKEIDGEKILKIINMRLGSAANIEVWYQNIHQVLTNLLNLGSQDKILELEIINSLMREEIVLKNNNLEFYENWNEFKGGKLL